MLEEKLPIHLPQQFREQTVLATAFYLSGYFFRQLKFRLRNPLGGGILLLLIPAVVAIFTEMAMGSVKGSMLFGYYLVSLAGTIGVIGISSWLAHQRIAGVCSYIGERTLYILTFHFLAFKLVSFLYIRYAGLPIVDLSQFPVLKDSPEGLWGIYTLVGVLLSLGVWELVHWIPKVRRN